jgi:hypothetical protein
MEKQTPLADAGGFVVELINVLAKRMNNEFVADGFVRRARGHDVKTREYVHAKLAGECQPQGFLGKIRFWFKRELGVLRGRNYGEKSSPKILW